MTEVSDYIWIIPFIIGISWMWYFLMSSGSNLLIIIGTYFIRIEAYLTILMLVLINLVIAIIGSVAKEKYLQYTEKKKEIEELITKSKEI